jgi:hypothetical protein
MVTSVMNQEITHIHLNASLGGQEHCHHGFGIFQLGKFEATIVWIVVGRCSIRRHYPPHAPADLMRLILNRAREWLAGWIPNHPRFR